MSGKKVYIFNPSTDMALADGSHCYTPPKSVRAYEDTMALLPSLYAPSGSFIVVPPYLDPKKLPFLKFASEKNITFGPLTSLPSDIVSIKPWGWNHTLINQLRKAGIRQSLLPEDKAINELRELSHRRLTIAMHKAIYEYFGETDNVPPREFFTESDALDYLRRTGCAYLKLPWSSSGRGVLKAESPDIENVRRRIKDCIKNQGSIMIEKAWDKVLDFALEWNCFGGKAHFSGYAIFQTDGLGNYKGNFIAPQKELKDSITEVSRENWNDRYIEAVQMALDTLVAPHYSGPLGVDMLIDKDGKINPCVEVNLRMSMGHVAIAISQYSTQSFLFRPTDSDFFTHQFL